MARGKGKGCEVVSVMTKYDAAVDDICPRTCGAGAKSEIWGQDAV